MPATSSAPGSQPKSVATRNARRATRSAVSSLAHSTGAAVTAGVGTAVSAPALARATATGYSQPSATTYKAARRARRIDARQQVARAETRRRQAIIDHALSDRQKAAKALTAQTAKLAKQIERQTGAQVATPKVELGDTNSTKPNKLTVTPKLAESILAKKPIAVAKVTKKLAKITPGAGPPKQPASPKEKRVAKRLTKAAKKAKPKVDVSAIPDMGNAQQVAPLVQRQARKHGLKPSILMAQIEQESGFNPLATEQEGKTISESQGGGETQFIPSTAAQYNVHYGDSRKAIHSQIRGQAKLMAAAGGATDPAAALGSYYGDHNPNGAYAQGILAGASKYASLDEPAGKGQPIPAPLKQKAQRVLGTEQTAKIIAHAKHGNDPASIKPSKHYVNPFPTADMGRIDMGVDYTGSGPIRAIGKAKVIQTGAAGWPSGGAGPTAQGVLYQLTEGPHAGKYVYTYEGITPTVKAGQTLKAGQQIGTFYPGSSIEIGWSDSAGAPLSHGYYSEGDVTDQGQKFAHFLGRISGHDTPTTGTGAPAVSSGGAGYVASPGAPAPAPTSSPATQRPAQRGTKQRGKAQRRRARQMEGRQRSKLIRSLISNPPSATPAPITLPESDYAAYLNRKVSLSL